MGKVKFLSLDQMTGEVIGGWKSNIYSSIDTCKNHVYYVCMVCLNVALNHCMFLVLCIACLIVLIATLNPAEGAALPTTCAAACLTSPDHYCKEVFRSECRKCSVTCSNPNNWNECEENCKGNL